MLFKGCKTGYKPLLALAVPLLLLGCSGTPKIEPTTPVEQPPEGRELSEIEQLLLQAETAPPLAKAQYTLAAAERLLEQQQSLPAQNLLQQINPLILPTPEQPRFWLLQAEAAAQLQQPQQSLDFLARITDPYQLDASHYQRYLDLRSGNYRQLGDSLAILLDLIDQSETAGADQQAVLSEQIWSQLKQIDDTQLMQLLSRQNSYQEQGWFELAQLNRNQVSGERQDILQLTEALDNWFNLWGVHPAAANLPLELQQLRQFSAQPPRHIGVLLPQSGRLAKHGKAVIEGLMAAHYQQLQQGQTASQLSFFDSSAVEDLKQLYLELEQQGVDLVIGPLDKNQLRQLTERPGLAIPTLALNAVSSSTTTLNLYQFGLRSEDEAIQSAEQAWADGHRIALSLTPATTWGDRIRTTFEQRWSELGGILARSERFTGDKDFSEKISLLVATDQSEARAQQLRQALGQKLEFEPRRRQDLDLLFLTALTDDARQIKPTLAFHYASRLPVYASSHLFDGDPDPARYRDLNQIRFTAMPWVVETDNPQRAQLSSYRDDTRSRFGRLYALGYDSYRLAPYLAQLQALPQAHLSGQSGELSIDFLGQVNRRQPWMLIRNGQLQPLSAR